MKRGPFRRNVPAIQAQKAFAGAGRVREIITQEDDVSSHLKAVSHCILRPDSEAGWYEYEEDLLLLVIAGRAELAWQVGGGLSIQSGDFVYIPAKEQFRLSNPSPQEFEALQVRIEA